MISIKKYSTDKQEIWDKFVKESLNGTFLFYRNYMDYHKDRFKDISLMIYEDELLVSIIPANNENGVFYSHAGISYGGFVVNAKMGAALMLKIFETLIQFLKDESFTKFIYKSIPNIFHKTPCEYDLYAIFRNNFSLSRREISTIVPIKTAIIKNGRKTGYNFAVNNGLLLKESDDLKAFISIANERLEEKYNVKTVHSAEEMNLLMSRFPNEIKLYGAFKDDKMLGGTIMYLINKTLHAQYIYMNDEGRKFRTLDFMMVKIIKELYKDYDYLDFGKSTENDGKYLNENLIKTKEEFGGTSICYDTYELDLQNE